MRKLSLGLWVVLAACDGKMSVDSRGPTAGSSGSAGAVCTCFDCSCARATAGTGGSSGYSGTAGSGIAGSGAGPGTLGEACIASGQQVEAAGTLAETQVRTLEHCQDGLACVAGQCVPVPDCPSATSDVCALYRGSAGASGAGGSGGAGNVGGSVGTAGANSSDPVSTSGITDMTVHGGTLYWTEYGTRDALGNHKHDGGVKSFALGSGALSQLASGLPGPLGIGVSDAHVYVLLDGAPLTIGARRGQLLRLPIAGGASELLQDVPPPYGFFQNGRLSSRFVAVAEQAFWIASDYALYAVSGQTGDVVTQVAPVAGGPSSDGSYVYFSGSGTDQGTVWRASLAGGAPEQVITPAYGGSAQAGLLYGMESLAQGVMLDSTSPSPGGSWTRVRALGVDDDYLRPVDAGRFFMGFGGSQLVGSDYSGDGLKTFTLSADPPSILLDPVPGPRAWVGTSGALYWSVGNEIHTRSLAGL